MFVIVKKKRFTELEETVKALSRQVCEISSEVEALTRVRENEKEMKASLTRTMNEWVYGKEGGENDDE